MQLNKPILLPGKRYPSKTDINLVMKEPKRQYPQKKKFLLAILILAGLLFVKFGVVDRLTAVYEAQTKAAEAEAELAEMQAKNADYDQVLAEYESFNLTKQIQSGSCDIMECLTLVKKNLISVSRVQAFTISGNTITIKISGVTLNQISNIYKNLTASPDVASVKVYTASTLSNAKTTTTSMTIQMKESEKTAAEDTITSNEEDRNET